ncbi:TPA: helix-turn-helix domain-containing protein, partial [Escherichia coli]
EHKTLSISWSHYPLRKGGYIEMNKGKLVAINRLPSEY